MARSYSLNWLRSDLEKTLKGMGVDDERLGDVLAVAYRYHEGQFREHKGGPDRRTPYITHPVGVAKICAQLWPLVSLHDSLEDILAVALTHDLLEDSAIGIEELESVTSPRVVELVQVLTKPISTAFRDRSERNSAFLSAISEAGASAKFVKICDALHNLSRPQSMPPTLLEKTIRKAKRDYLPLTFDPAFSAEIRRRFETAIGTAEAALVATGGARRDFTTIEDFLGYCIERASGKVLETHDIVDILLELPGLNLVHMGPIPEFEHQVLTKWLDPKARATSARLVKKLLDKGELALSGKGFSRESVRELGFQRLFILPMDSSARDLMRRHFLVLGSNGRKAFPWMAVASMRAIVAVLSERQREREVRELADYSELVSKTGLAIDPRRAAELRLSHQQMQRLARLADAATIQCGAIMAAVGLIGRSMQSATRILLLEHRIKTAESAATKLVERANGDWSGLDDIIGIRVVLANETAVRRFLEIFLAQTEDPASVWNVDIGLVPKSIDHREIETAIGYRALHIRFHVRSAIGEVGTVACEVQVRTVFQDAWARLAHEVQYKSSAHNSRQLRRGLRELAQLRDAADRLSDKLMS